MHQIVKTTHLPFALLVVSKITHDAAARGSLRARHVRVHQLSTGSFIVSANTRPSKSVRAYIDANRQLVCE